MGLMTYMTEEALLDIVVRSRENGVQLYMRPVNSNLMYPREKERILWMLSADATVEGEHRKWVSQGCDLDAAIRELAEQIPPELLRRKTSVKRKQKPAANSAKPRVVRRSKPSGKSGVKRTSSGPSKSQSRKVVVKKRA